MDRENSTWRRRVEAMAQDAGRAYAVALRAVQSPALAEEAVQEAYAKLLKNPPADLGEEAGLVYFLKTVRATAINLSISNARRDRREDVYMASRETREPSPAECLDAAEMAQAARSALEGLPQEEREVVGLCCEQGLTHRVASEILSVPERTLSDRLERGLGKLRLRLTAQGFAAAAPAGIACGLRELGVPPAPHGLQASIQSLGASVTEVSAQAARSSIRAFPAPGPALWIAAGGLLIALGVGWALGFRPGNRPAVSPAPAPATQASSPAPDQPEFHQQWNFAEKPAREFDVSEGVWNWKRPAGAEVGCMAGAHNQWVATALPINIPPRPVLVTAKIFWRQPRDANFIDAGWLQDGLKCPATVRGKEPYTGKRGGLLNVEYYCLNQFVITRINGTTGRISAYEKPYPGNRIYLRFFNAEVQELGVRSLRAEEVHSELRNPEHLFR